MAKGKETIVEEPIVEEGTPAIFLRQVDVVIQNEGEDPIIIPAPVQETVVENEPVEEPIIPEE